MNIFQKYTLRVLGKNKARTIATFVGIMLSMALLTAVAEGAYSGIEYLKEEEIEASGSWHGFYYSLSEEEVLQAEGSNDLKSKAVLSEIGWAEIDNSNEYKPYLYIQSADEDITDMVGIRLVSGEMPQNGNEIIISQHLIYNGGVDIKVGDELTVAVGKRVGEGGADISLTAEYTPGGEEIADASVKSYKVVGIFRRLEIEPYSCPGYFAFTKGDGDGISSIVFTSEDPSHIYNNVIDELSNRFIVHSSLIKLEGGIGDGGIKTLVVGFAVVLIILIIFGSAALIYNAFSISISERTRQFGILRSIGATGSQIRSAVFCEAFILGLAGIAAGAVLGCLGIGVTLYCLKDAFRSVTASGTDNVIHLVVSGKMLIISAAVCMATVLVSAALPALRARRISPLAAIRQSEDIKISRKDVKTSSLFQKLFGFEGMIAAKNSKRNRKKYRAVIISLAVSIILFISASSYCDYLKKSADMYNYNDSGADLSYTASSKTRSAAEIKEALAGAGAVTDSLYYSFVLISLEPEDGSDIFTDEYRALYMPDGDVTDADGNILDEEIYAEVVFLEDAQFDKMCEDAGIDASLYYDKSSPKAVFFNNSITSGARGGKDVEECKVIKDECIPCTLKYSAIRDEANGCDGAEGYIYYGREEENGEVYYYYLDPEYLTEYMAEADSTESIDLSRALSLGKAVRLHAEDALINLSFDVNDTVMSLPFAFTESMPMLLYPYSMMENAMTDIGGDTLSYQLEDVSFAFTSSDHARTYEEMSTIITDMGMNPSLLTDQAENESAGRMVITIINVFSYGFIILIALIDVANVFNTISTSIMLRRREIAMMRSLGLSDKGFRKMMNLECTLYGIKALVIGIPASIAVAAVIYMISASNLEIGFSIPIKSIIIAIFAVFAVVFSSMIYATAKIRHEDIKEALQNENL